VDYHREFDYVAERMCPVKSRAFHAAETQLLWELRQSLRRGSLFHGNHSSASPWHVSHESSRHATLI
jgi:hypothetical protein